MQKLLLALALALLVVVAASSAESSDVSEELSPKMQQLASDIVNLEEEDSDDASDADSSSSGGGDDEEDDEDDESKDADEDAEEAYDSADLEETTGVESDEIVADFESCAGGRGCKASKAHLTRCKEANKAVKSKTCRQVQRAYSEACADADCSRMSGRLGKLMKWAMPPALTTEPTFEMPKVDFRIPFSKYYVPKKKVPRKCNAWGIGYEPKVSLFKKGSLNHPLGKPGPPHMACTLYDMMNQAEGLRAAQHSEIKKMQRKYVDARKFARNVLRHARHTYKRWQRSIKSYATSKRVVIGATAAHKKQVALVAKLRNEAVSEATDHQHDQAVATQNQVWIEEKKAKQLWQVVADAVKARHAAFKRMVKLSKSHKAATKTLKKAKAELEKKKKAINAIWGSGAETRRRAKWLKEAHMDARRWAIKTGRTVK